MRKISRKEEKRAYESTSLTQQQAQNTTSVIQTSHSSALCSHSRAELIKTSLFLIWKGCFSKIPCCRQAFQWSAAAFCSSLLNSAPPGQLSAAASMHGFPQGSLKPYPYFPLKGNPYCHPCISPQGNHPLPPLLSRRHTSVRKRQKTEEKKKSLQILIFLPSKAIVLQYKYFSSHCTREQD